MIAVLLAFLEQIILCASEHWVYLIKPALAAQGCNNNNDDGDNGIK